MSSARYSTSSFHWRRYSPSILTSPQSGQVSLAATPSQWSYAPKKSCPVDRRKGITASVLPRCLGISPTEARVSHGFPKLIVFWFVAVYLSMCVEMMVFALLSIKGTSS
ncbi:uncharacterized protein TNCV_5010671 [Trichonephila clavipes]|nr:uncharacterized protein TNCV_5010671 [Trichonephila clavipes]